jgi:hypothetical protein
MGAFFKKCLASVCIDVGAATREFSFQLPFQAAISELIASADAASATDKFTPSVVVNGTTVLTGADVTAADTPIVNAVNQGADKTIPAYTTCKIVITFAGTPANVKGINVSLWGYPKR